MKNEKKFIIADIMDIIVDKAGDDLFRTPLPSEIPTDSFAEDYEVQDM